LLYGDSMMYIFYKIDWVGTIALYFWPIFNILFMIFVVRNRLLIAWFFSFWLSSISHGYLYGSQFLILRFFSDIIWPIANFILFIIILVKLLRGPSKFLNLSKK